MSVRVKDLLTLPSLREATVLSGANQLTTSVSSLSFLEMSNMTLFYEKFQQLNEYHTGELLIGSFCDIRDDIAKQCEAIRHLHELGEIGIILYYVGIILPTVADEVLQVADSLGFIIIQMPTNNAALRYNEVIYEVMKLLLNKNKTETFATELLNRLSVLPERNRNVEMALKILSDFLKVHLLITNSTDDILNQVSWPWNSQLPLPKLVEQYLLNPQKQPIMAGNCYSVQVQKLQQQNGQSLKLFCISEDEGLTTFEMEQAVKVLQMALNLWGRNYDEVSEQALVRAIIHDESEKMYRLAKKLSIDIAAVETMWLLPLWDKKVPFVLLKKEMKNSLRPYYQTIIIQAVANCVIVLLGNCMPKQSELAISKEYWQTTSYQAAIHRIIVCPKLVNTAGVRKLYQITETTAPFLKRIYPKRQVLAITELKTVYQVMVHLKDSQEQLAAKLAVLQPLLSHREYLTTLGTFLLDASSDFKKCGELLFIHKNTVKYRLRKISEYLGYDMTNPAEAYVAYIALILYRLIEEIK
ncbi:PucR family transcriptional regulator [Enterococcus faecalis]